MLRAILVVTIGCQLSACGMDSMNRRPDAHSDLAPSSVPTPGAIQTHRSLENIERVIGQLPPSKTLAVFDIDDTLLTTRSNPRYRSDDFFGSDWWFGWQYKLPETDAQKVPCLFDFVAMNYAVGQQTVTEKVGPKVLARVSEPKMLLTSRSPDYREATQRDLKAEGYPLLQNLGGQKFAFVVNDDGNVMTYANGVYMTKGYDKGKALLALLDSLDLGKAYTDVVLVDDGSGNLAKMKAALDGRQIKFHGFHYIKVKNDLDMVLTDRMKRRAMHDWRTWLRAVGKAYPARQTYFEKNECKIPPQA